MLSVKLLLLPQKVQSSLILALVGQRLGQKAKDVISDSQSVLGPLFGCLKAGRDLFGV